jgi:hypothetical protein
MAFMLRVAILILLAGCTANEGDTSSTKAVVETCAAGTDSQIVAGHGELSYEEFDQGGHTNVELIHGPQGGFHSTIAVRGIYLDLEISYHIRLVGTIDGTEMGWGTPYSQFRCNYQAGAQEYTGGLLIWDASPEDLHDKVAHVEITVLDPTKESAEGGPTVVGQDSAEFTIWDPTLEI